MEFATKTAAPSAPIWTTEGPAMMPLESVEVDATKTTMFERRFNPYDFNGG
jgi:hypothetical protein